MATVTIPLKPATFLADKGDCFQKWIHGMPRIGTYMNGIEIRLSERWESYSAVHIVNHNLPFELIELDEIDFDIRIRRYELRQDNGAFGLYLSNTHKETKPKLLPNYKDLTNFGIY